jgi:hypothetical protein
MQVTPHTLSVKKTVQLSHYSDNILPMISYNTNRKSNSSSTTNTVRIIINILRCVIIPAGPEFNAWKGLQKTRI